MTDIRQSKGYAKYLNTSGWKVHKLRGAYYFLKKILFVNVVKIQRPETIDKDLIGKIIIRHKPVQIMVHPNNKIQEILLNKLNFKPSNSPYIPTKTLVIDLTKTEGKILSSFKKDARYCLNKSKNIKVSDVKNTKIFYDAWKLAIRHKRIISSEKNLYNLKKAFLSSSLLLASHNDRDRVTAGAIFLIADNTCFYWQAFTTKEGRSSLAQYQLVWKGIIWAKRKNCKYFDLEGIYDPRFPIRSWKGFTHFKKSFGGVEKDYPGAYRKFYF